jgi:hypothetical protein
MATRPSPIDLQKYLKGVDYPAKRTDLVQTARSEGAGNEVISALEHIPDREYDGPNAVSQAVFKGR